MAEEELIARRIVGLAAIGAGVAWVIWIIISGVTHGDLDAGGPAGGPPRLYKFGQLLMVSWNLLLIPAALVLWRWLQHKDPDLMLLYTVSGITSLMFWAYGAATHGITPSLEVTYLLLSGLWWLGIGHTLLSERRALAIFTSVLGLFSLLDGALTFFEPMPLFIYVMAAPKLPLSAVWDLWLGVTLLKSPSGSKL